MKGKATVIVAVAVLAMCLSVSLMGAFFEQSGSEPEKGASAEGVWHQTLTRGYYEGAKISTTYESNDLTIAECKDYSDPHHFLTCRQRGVQFTGLRNGDRMVWDYSTDTGRYIAISDCYGQCLIVNEFCITLGQRNDAFVSSSVYTKDNVVPDWFYDRQYELPDKKWLLNEAVAISDTATAELGGKSLYMLENNGPVFKAEMEQSVGTTISTKMMVGSILDQDESGYIFAIALDDSSILWMMTFTGDSVIMSAVSESDFAAIDGYVAVMRRYIEVFDASLPVMAKPPIRSGYLFELKEAIAFESEAWGPVLTEGYMEVQDDYHSVSYSIGSFTDTLDTYSAEMYAFTLPTNVEDRYFFYCYFEGELNIAVPIWGRGLGSYDASTGVLIMDMLLTTNGVSQIIEMTYQRAD